MAKKKNEVVNEVVRDLSDAALRKRASETPIRDARIAQGEWAYSGNPSPEEQAEAAARREALAELRRRGL